MLPYTMSSDAGHLLAFVFIALGIVGFLACGVVATVLIAGVRQGNWEKPKEGSTRDGRS